jgi:hypothetical protein
MSQRAYLWAFVIAAFTSWSLKGMAMSVRWDPGVSKPVRDTFASVERSMGFGGGGVQTHPHGYRPMPGLHAGWIAGRRNDLSDNQWKSFRDNLPLLAIAAVATSALARAMRRAVKDAKDAGRVLVPFHVVYGAVFAFFLHGFGAIWPIGLAVAHYFVCRATAGVPTVGLLAVWASAIVMLAKVQFGADKWTFAALGSMSPLLSPLAGMDKWIFRGFMPRWWIHYNLVTLRMISFGCDLHWRRCGRESAGDEKSKSAVPAGTTGAWCLNRAIR